MCRRHVEDKEHNTLWMGLLENGNGLVNLNKQLGVIPPWITAHPWINNGSCVLDNVPLLVADDKAAVFFLDKIGDVDDAATSLLLEDLLMWQMPFHTCHVSVLKDSHSGAHHIFCLYLFA